MLSVAQIAFLLILGAGLVLLASERLRIELTALLLIVALAASGVLTPLQALTGFVSDALLIVVGVLVMSAALAASGATTRIADWIGHHAGASEWRSLLVIMPAVALLSAVSHHLMVTAMMLPVLLDHARRTGIAASRLLMPMAFAASLGTTITVFAAPSMLLADTVLRQAGRPGLGVLSLAPLGLALTALGIVFMQLTRGLLPRRRTVALDPAPAPGAGASTSPGRVLRTVAILAGSIGVAVAQPRLAAAAFLGGGVLMVLGRCLAPHAALRAIDLRIVLLIAAAVPLGLAMDLTGTGMLAAQALDPLLAGWGSIGRLLAMFWAAALLTQLLSDAATTVLLAPVALHLAGSLGPSPEAAVICTAVGAVTGFLTPIGHHGSLLVMRPGGYRFADYLRIGLPLTALASIVTVCIAAWRWPLTP